MSAPRLEVNDPLGRRIVTIETTPFSIGRRDTNHLRLGGGEVSRDHAEIVSEAAGLTLYDRGSRYGTFVNETQVAERVLRHGDRIRLGRGGGADLVFLAEEVGALAEPSATTAIGDLRHVAALLEGLRALGSGRVLDDVLALVLDSAIDVSGAERGFVMLASAEGQLEFKMSRARGRITLSGNQFQTSRKIPEQVFDTGEARLVADLLDGDLPNVHMGTVALGIRNVLCVPLRLVRYVEAADAASAAETRIGVLYLDSRERGSLLSTSTRSALETLATEAAVAIENARLYRETLEKARLEQEMRIAAEIQQALLPRRSQSGRFYDAMAASVPCRSIGGDFFDCFELATSRLGFALGDVAGKGPPAALLSALMQGIFAAEASGSAEVADAVRRINEALIRRAIESRYVTLFYGMLSADGTLTYCNAGHNPPVVVGADGEVRRLEAGGPPVGLFEFSPYEPGSVTLQPGDAVVVFSDGVSEALNVGGEEFGDSRLVDVVRALRGRTPKDVLEGVLAEVKDFQGRAVQNDDMTALVVRFQPGLPT